MPIRHDESRRRQATLLEVGQHRPPRDRRFCGRELQGHEPFLAGQCAPKGHEDGHRDHAARQPDLQVHAIEEQHGVALVGQGARLPGREQHLQPPDDPRDGALREMLVSQQRPQGRPNPSTVCARQIAAQNGRIHLACASGIPGDQLAPKLPRRTVGVAGPAPAARAAAAPRRGSSGCGRRCRGDSLPAGPCARGAPIPAPPVSSASSTVSIASRTCSRSCCSRSCRNANTVGWVVSFVLLSCMVCLPRRLRGDLI